MAAMDMSSCFPGGRHTCRNVTPEMGRSSQGIPVVKKESALSERTHRSARQKH